MGQICSIVRRVFGRHTRYEVADSCKAPAREVVKYEVTHFNATLWINSSYVQPPSPETDKAWHDLVDSESVPILYCSHC